MKITAKTSQKKVLNLGSNCKRNGNCCKWSSGYVLPDEKKELAKFMGLKEKEFEKKYLNKVDRYNTKVYKFKIRKKKGKPFGPCIFFSDAGKALCKIHDVKPLHCRVGICDQHGEDITIWYALNYLVNKNDPESVRQWAIYLKSGKTIEGGELMDLIPDKKRLKKILSFEIL